MRVSWVVPCWWGSIHWRQTERGVRRRRAKGLRCWRKVCWGENKGAEGVWTGREEAEGGHGDGLRIYYKGDVREVSFPSVTFDQASVGKLKFLQRGKVTLLQAREGWGSGLPSSTRHQVCGLPSTRKNPLYRIQSRIVLLMEDDFFFFIIMKSVLLRDCWID